MIVQPAGFDMFRFDWKVHRVVVLSYNWVKHRHKQEIEQGQNLMEKLMKNQQSLQSKFHKEKKIND